MFFKVVRFALHFLDKNIHVSTQVLHFIKFLVKLCSQPFQVSQKSNFLQHFFDFYMLQFGLTRNKEIVILRPKIDKRFIFIPHQDNISSSHRFKFFARYCGKEILCYTFGVFILNTTMWTTLFETSHTTGTLSQMKVLNKINKSD